MDIVSASMTASLPAVSSSMAPVAVNSPDPLATARFSAIMETVKDTQAHPAISESVRLASGVTADQSLGDRILNGLGGASHDFKESWNKMSSAVDGGLSTTMSEMLKMQMNLARISIQYDLVGKVVSRSTQNVEQLVKIQ